MTLHTATSSSRPTVTTTLLPHDQSSAFPTTYNVPIGGDAEPWITLSQVDNLFHVKKNIYNLYPTRVIQKQRGHKLCSPFLTYYFTPLRKARISGLKS